MEFEIINFKDLPEKTQLSIASHVSSFTNGQMGEIPQMLPISIEEVFNKYDIDIGLYKSKFAGVIAANQLIEWNGLEMSELGTLIVDKEYRNHGFGFNLVEHMSSKLADQNIGSYAFCNHNSLPIFKKAGFVVAQTCEIPDEAFELCQSCPALPKSGCCDTTVIYLGE